MLKGSLIIMLFLLPLKFYGQEDVIPGNIIYVIDSVPIIEEPEEGMNTLDESHIDNMVVVEEPKELEKLGFGKYDGAIFIFTKEYAKRSDELKIIPTTKRMIKDNGVWYLKNSETPYSGKFIDYFVTGLKEGQGVFKNGRVEGLRIKYYPNGNKSLERNYKNGLEDGLENEYYPDGQLKQTGQYSNLKESGKWEMYYPNGQPKLTSYFENGVMYNETIQYYSTGKIKSRQTIKNGKPSLNKSRQKVINMYNKGLAADRVGSFKNAIKSYSKCIDMDSTFVDAYFAKGTSELNNFQFDEAYIDLTTALTIEPLFAEAYANRAFSLIRKHEMAGSKQLSKNADVTVIISKAKTNINSSDKKRICEDLALAISLGDKSLMVLRAVEEFCK